MVGAAKMTIKWLHSEINNYFLSVCHINCTRPCYTASRRNLVEIKKEKGGVSHSSPAINEKFISPRLLCVPGRNLREIARSFRRAHGCPFRSAVVVLSSSFSPFSFLQPGRDEDSMFSLKGRFSYDIPVRHPGQSIPGNFSPVPAPATGADVGDHFIKLLYYSSGPCGGPGCPFSEAIFYRDICRGGLGPPRRSPRRAVRSLRTFGPLFYRRRPSQTAIESSRYRLDFLSPTFTRVVSSTIRQRECSLIEPSNKTCTTNLEINPGEKNTDTWRKVSSSS